VNPTDETAVPTVEAAPENKPANFDVEHPDRRGSVMVVGGGISGMQTALDLADAGFRVHILDGSGSIGGVMAQLDKTFPTNDCSMCIMAPKLVGTGRHRNIELITNAKLESVEGKAGNFRVTYRRYSRRVDEVKCTGCGACAERCPVEVEDEYNERLIRRTAIHVKYPQAVPLVYSIDRDACIGCGLCAEYCKADAIIYDEKEVVKQLGVGAIVLSPGFGKFSPAALKEYGYGVYSNVVTSTEFERMLSATGPTAGMLYRPDNGDVPGRVAFLQCVGSRDEKNHPYCSSVCCMYSIKEAVIAKEHTRGLEADIYYMDMRAYGKEFDDYLERAKGDWKVGFRRARVSHIEELPDGMLRLFYATDEGATDEGETGNAGNGHIRTEDYDLVVLATGLESPPDAKELAQRTGIELNEHGFAATTEFAPLATTREGIYVAGAFHAPKDIPDTVAQASGAAAMAGSLLAPARFSEVTPVEYPEEKPVTGRKPRVGVFVCHCGINIGGVVDVPGVAHYAASLPNVEFVDHNLYTCSQDTQERIKEMVEEHRLNRVVVASCTPRTHEPLFMSTVREAGLNPFLFEMANIRDQCSWVHHDYPELATEKAKELVRMAVAKVVGLKPLHRRIIDVWQSALVLGGGIAGMTAALAIAENGFEVHLVEKEGHLGGMLNRIHKLASGEDPAPRLRELAERLEAHPKLHVHTDSRLRDISGFVGQFESVIDTPGGEIELRHGAVVMAVGAEEHRPAKFLHGSHPGVMTRVELEEKMKDPGFAPPSTVFIQCVGSRDDERPFCSRTCCVTALKNALDLKERDPGAEVTVLFRDMRSYGFREALYREAMEAGVKFMRYDPERPPVVEADDTHAALHGKLSVKAFDRVLGEEIEFNPELVVLSNGLQPVEDARALSEMLKVPLTKDGFFLEAHMKLRPVDFATEGVYLAGAAHSPKFVDETISQALGTAARASTVLSRETMESEAVTAFVDESACRGCGDCVDICPFDAIELEDKNMMGYPVAVAVVNEIKCKGCGSCVAGCVAGAIQQGRFEDSHLLAVVDAFLGGDEE